MAGIGFRLEKILKGDTYIDAVKAHFYSAIICSGPWILSIITIFCLNYFAPSNIDIYEMLYFRSMLIYIFAFSLVFVGLLYLSLTRYISDKLYVHEYEALVPAFNSAFLLVLGLQTIIGATFLCFVQGSILLRLVILMTYLTISLIWVIMIFLTALRDYHAIMISYAAGSVVTVLAGIMLGQRFGLVGYFGGYLVGHLLIVILLSARIFIEFPSRHSFDRYILNIFPKYKYLVGIGVLYNLGIWIDKMVFWGSSKALEIAPMVRIFPEYDSAVFFAYLTIIPAMSVFMIQIETDFYVAYRNYYGSLLKKVTYAQIQRGKRQLTHSLRVGFGRVLSFQGLITLLTLVFSAKLAGWLHIQSVQLPIFRITVLGAFLHSLLLIMIIIILYFDFQKLGFGIAALFVILNGWLTYLTKEMHSAFYGYGYFGAVLITLIVSYFCLDFQIRRLEYLTFAAQPVGTHREEEIM